MIILDCETLRYFTQYLTVALTTALTLSSCATPSVTPYPGNSGTMTCAFSPTAIFVASIAQSPTSHAFPCKYTTKYSPAHLSSPFVAPLVRMILSAHVVIPSLVRPSPTALDPPHDVCALRSRISSATSVRLYVTLASIGSATSPANGAPRQSYDGAPPSSARPGNITHRIGSARALIHVIAVPVAVAIGAVAVAASSARRASRRLASPPPLFSIPRTAVDAPSVARARSPRVDPSSRRPVGGRVVARDRSASRSTSPRAAPRERHRARRAAATTTRARDAADDRDADDRASARASRTRVDRRRPTDRPTARVVPWRNTTF